MVLDPAPGAAVFVGEGEALEPFWWRLRQSRADIQAVAMDASKVYIHARCKHLTATTIVFDHFHPIKLFNDKFQKFRPLCYSSQKIFMGNNPAAVALDILPLRIEEKIAEGAVPVSAYT